MKILSFSPHNALWTIAFPMGLVLEALQKAGHDVTYLHCDRMYPSFCMARAGYGVGFLSSQEQKEEICRICTGNSALMRKSLGLAKGGSLSSHLTSEDHSRTEALLGTVTQENFRDLVVEGIPVGRYASYEFLIQNKKSAVTFTESEWGHYRTILANALLSLFAFRRALEEYRPEICLFDHTLYSNNRVCKDLADQRGLKSFFLYSNSFNIAHMFELLMLGRSDMYALMDHAKEIWAQYRPRPVAPSDVKMVIDHYSALVQAKGHVYSPGRRRGGKTVREIFGIKPSQKILLATMSSYDEIVAADVAGYDPSSKHEVFSSQIDWISRVLDYVAARPDLFFIIRVHPRELTANESVSSSEHAQQLRERLQRLPPNAAVNWPEQKLSLFNLAEETDVALNAWSSAGMEMNFLGIPVVAYCPGLLFYPADMNYTARSVDEYFRCVEQALADGWRFDRTIVACRWYALVQLRIALDVSSSFRLNTLEKRPLPVRAVRRLGSMLSDSFVQKMDVWSRCSQLPVVATVEKVLQEDLASPAELPLPAVSPEDFAREERALRDGIGRLYEIMYGARRPPERLGTLQEKLWGLIQP